MPGADVERGALMAVAPPAPIKLNARRLFRALNARTDALSFLGSASWDLLQGGALQAALDTRTPAAMKKLDAVWRTLIIDAVHFLRINDCRERAFLVSRTGDADLSNKTTMETPGAEQGASLNAYGIEELQDYFSEFTNFESTLYGADRYYRDHIQHPIRVWLIGLNLLHEFGAAFRLRVAGQVQCKKAPCADPKWEQFDDLLGRSGEGTSGEGVELGKKQPAILLSTAELVAMWTIAALTHDLGYPLEKVERVNDQLERMLNKFGKIGFRRSDFTFQTQHDHLVEHLLRTISSSVVPSDKNEAPCCTHLRPKYYAKFSKSWETFDHGIVSSLILLRSLTFFLETDLSLDESSDLSAEDARQFAVRSEILHAIAAHTTPKVYHLAANTLPFLLVLCDELQEWDRPNMADLRGGVLSGSAKQVTICERSITEKESTLSCKIEYKPRASDDQRRHAIRVFKSWHERLRPAADDRKRRMKFTWEMWFQDTPVPWRFILDTQEPVFRQVSVYGPRKGDTSKTAEYSLYDE